MNAILTLNCGGVTKIPLKQVWKMLRAIGRVFSQASATTPPIHTYLHTELPHTWPCLILEMTSTGKTSFPDRRDAAFIDFSLKSHKLIQRFLTPLL